MGLGMLGMLARLDAGIVIFVEEDMGRERLGE